MKSPVPQLLLVRSAYRGGRAPHGGRDHQRGGVGGGPLQGQPVVPERQWRKCQVHHCEPVVSCADGRPRVRPYRNRPSVLQLDPSSHPPARRGRRKPDLRDRRLSLPGYRDRLQGPGPPRRGPRPQGLLDLGSGAGGDSHGGQGPAQAVGRGPPPALLRVGEGDLEAAGLGQPAEVPQRGGPGAQRPDRSRSSVPRIGMWIHSGRLLASYRSSYTALASISVSRSSSSWAPSWGRNGADPAASR